MAKREWKKTTFPGVRYREHETRKHGVKNDQYFVISYRVNGKRKDEGLGWAHDGWSAKKAAALLAEIKENQRRGEGPLTIGEKRDIETERRVARQEEEKIQERMNITFSKFFTDTYLPAASHKKETTVYNEKILFKKWIEPEIGHLPFNKISGFNLDKIKKAMTDSGKAERSIQYCLALARQIWNHGKIAGLTTVDFPKVKIKKFDNRRLRYFKPEEAVVLLKELKQSSEQLHDMALLSLHTGARAGEIFSLTWGSVDFENGVLVAKDTKSGKTRFLYLTNDTRAMLKERFNDQPVHALVFADKKGNKIAAVSNTFDRVVERLGFNEGIDDRRDKASFHTLRHTFASWLVQHGTDLYTVKELLGHSTIALTERYSHLRPEGLKSATAAVFDNMRSEQDNVVGMDRQKRKIVK